MIRNIVVEHELQDDSTEPEAEDEGEDKTEQSGVGVKGDVLDDSFEADKVYY